ncbi:MAG: hypothetical protein EHM20_14380 [Alphaproteobacteria bacterium]|nr:MAG: hypothetical protein EHM20_14380 [Alphaproteobacteria bacterium]
MTIQELKSDPNHEVFQSFERFWKIGNIRFQIITYTVFYDDRKYIVFGCYHSKTGTSQVFYSFRNAIKYAIDTYNEKFKEQQEIQEACGNHTT